MNCVYGRTDCWGGIFFFFFHGIRSEQPRQPDKQQTCMPSQTPKNRENKLSTQCVWHFRYQIYVGARPPPPPVSGSVIYLSLSGRRPSFFPLPPLPPKSPPPRNPYARGPGGGGGRRLLAVFYFPLTLLIRVDPSASPLNP